MKKIIIIEDNYMVKHIVERTLRDNHFDVIAFDNGQEALDYILKFNISVDLLITDLEMPKMGGIDFIKKIKSIEWFTPKIIVISANHEDNAIIEAIQNGADEYITKPISSQLLLIKIFKLLEITASVEEIVLTNNNIINKNIVGIVIPCYNEETRLHTQEFKNFILKNSSYHLCFVNDGSEDKTLQVLENFKSGNEEYISVVNLTKNRGKAEAVRQGIQSLLQKEHMEFIGFLDADLSTDFSDFEMLIDEISKKKYTAVIGSRISRIGAEINKDSSRAIISKFVNLLIQNIISMPFKDTQCGAKIFSNDLATIIFDKPFISRWLFDVEIFIRIRNLYGKDKAHEKICEMPLKRWIHMDMSKLKFSDSMKIFTELFRIKFHYK